MDKSTRISPKKDFLFWSKIIATQYLIRHPFWKSFSLPIIIGQMSQYNKTDYTHSNYVTIVYILIACHFLSGIFVSDRKFRHALGFLPHILALGCTCYLYYTNIYHQLTPWLKIRIPIHSIGTISTFCFIASLHTTSPSFRSILRRLSSYLNVFYHILNAYILWWSHDEKTLFHNHLLWIIVLSLHAFVCFLVSGGFCLEIFLIQSCRFAIYLIFSTIILDILILSNQYQSKTNFWLIIDYLIDDLAILCGSFYFYQFHLHQMKKTD